MTEEIKEILKYIDQFVYVDQTYNDIKLSKIDTKLILDYITNLQQKNEDFKTIIKQYVDIVLHDRKEIDRLQQENETLKAKLEIGKTCGFCPYYDYKSRCEKAIEYIENNKKETSSHFNGKEYVYRNFTLCCEPNDLLNILNGVDENETNS